MTPLEELTKRHITLPLSRVKGWQPFQIDALGLVTLLGADEVNQSVGTLQHRRYTEYLPLLAAFVVAGDRFVSEQPGFVIYNLTDGITSTELKGWFTRWLMSQRINNATTVLEWDELKKHNDWKYGIAPALSFILVAPLLFFTVLIGDWCGVGNAAAIIISIFTRICLLWQRRHARDSGAHPSGSTENAIKTLCIVRSDGKMVTCKAPASVLTTFVKDHAVKYPRYYLCARWVSWLALGVHMCILGMCSLFTQIYTVFLLVLSTWALTSDFSWDIGRTVAENAVGGDDGTEVFHIPFNRDWHVKQTNHFKGDDGKKDRRQVAWARLSLGDGGDETMNRWNLLPIKAKNPDWWTAYEALKDTFGGGKEKQSDTPPAQDGLVRATTPPAQDDPVRPTMPQTTPSRTALTADASPPGTLGSSVSPTSTRDLSPTPGPGDTPAAGVA